MRFVSSLNNCCKVCQSLCLRRCRTYLQLVVVCGIWQQACVDYVRSFNLPMLVLGGGGYTIRNVSRCWAMETGVLLRERLDDVLPFNDYYEYYGMLYHLHCVVVGPRRPATATNVVSVPAACICRPGLPPSNCKEQHAERQQHRVPELDLSQDLRPAGSD